MYLTIEKKQEFFKKFGGDVKNTGSTEAQIALFTYRIAHLTEHLKKNKKDKHTQKALLDLVGKRKSISIKKRRKRKEIQGTKATEPRPQY